MTTPSIRIQRWGNGPRTVLALHGWGGDHRTFVPLVPHLPPGVRLVAADLPGYGGSSALATPSLESLAEWIAALAEAEGCGGPVTLLGSCSGAVFGLLAARVCPERFEHLVLVDPFAYFPWYLRVFVTPVLGPVAYWSTFANPVGRWLTNASLAEHRTGESDLASSFAEIDHGATLGSIRLLAEIPGGYRHFAEVSLPTTILIGERTFDAIRTSAGLWSSIWPHAVVHEVPGAGHLPLEEQPAQVAALAFGVPSPTADQGVNPQGTQVQAPLAQPVVAQAPSPRQ